VIRRPASLHAVPRCVSRFPRFTGRLAPPLRYYQGAATSRRSSRRASFPSLGGAVDALASSLPPVVNARPAGLGSLRFGQPVPRWCSRRKRRDLPSSWGTPIAPSPGSSTPAGPSRRLTGLRDAVARPPWRRRQGLLHCGFRGSIPRLWCSLSTLRPGGRPPGTQDSLPAAGQALPGGLGPQGSNERFQSVCPYISSSSPKLAWRKGRVITLDFLSEMSARPERARLPEDLEQAGRPRRATAQVKWRLCSE
jgi:hypothetical protein